MEFELQAPTIILKLIRVFACVDEWIDHCDAYPLESRERQQSLLTLMTIAKENQKWLSGIVDYRMEQSSSPHADQKYSRVEGFEITKVETAAFREVEPELTALRAKLRNQLSDLLYLLEISEDEDNPCRVAILFSNGSEMEIKSFVVTILRDIQNNLNGLRKWMEDPCL